MLALCVGWTGVKHHAGGDLPSANLRIDPRDDTQMGEESPPEIPGPTVCGTELVLQGSPRNPAWSTQIAHPVGEPGVDVDRQGRALQQVNCPEVDRHCRTSHLLEGLTAEPELGMPARLLP